MSRTGVRDLREMDHAPKVSVLMAVRNGMPYLPRTIESILAQELADFELLVVDDGSTDGTGECVGGLRDQRIQYHRVGRVGFCEALNYGLHRARTPLVARIDADDLAYPARLARQYEYLNAHPRCVVVGCQTDEIDPEDRVVGKRTFPLSDAAIRWQMAFGCPLLHPSVMYRRDEVIAVGGYKPGTWPAEDYDLWVRLSERGTMANLPETLMRYRLRPESVTLSRAGEQVALCSRIAAAYASRICPEIDRAAVADLYHFFSDGRDPQETGFEAMLAAFQSIRDHFLQAAAPSDELRERIAAVQQVLRWYCLERAQRAWRRPLRAWGWLRLAGQFDPDNGSLRSMLGRRLRKWTSRIGH